MSDAVINVRVVGHDGSACNVCGKNMTQFVVLEDGQADGTTVVFTGDTGEYCPNCHIEG